MGLAAVPEALRVLRRRGESGESGSTGKTDAPDAVDAPDAAGVTVATANSAESCRGGVAGGRNFRFMRRLPLETSPCERLLFLALAEKFELEFSQKGSGMNCQQLAGRIERIYPNAAPRDVARLCLLLSNAVGDVESLEDEKRLRSVWREMSLRMQAATDQHAAVTEELESVTQEDPRRLTAEQVWVLIRAVRVQSQMLELYVGSSSH